MNPIGERYGRLTVIAVAVGRRKVVTRCECGKEKKIFLDNARRGLTTSCGCGHRDILVELKTIHSETSGHTKTPEYVAWDNMKQRCLNQNRDQYEDYGGRGIEVCARWLHSFENFLADIGRRPSPKHTLDRYPDNDGNYEPGNVRWATRSEQSRNRRRFS